MLPLRDHNPSRTLPLATLAIIAATLYGFWQELTAADLQPLITAYALTPAAVDASRPATWLPFLTAMFLHAGWLHVLANLWFLWIFGDNVEDRLGRIRYLFLYLASGIAAGLAQYAVMPASPVPVLGASGAVAGVLGAYWIFFPKHTIDTFVPLFGFGRVIPLPAMVMIGYWFLTQLFAGVGSLAVETVATGGVAFFAHIGGFVAGALGALVLGGRRRRTVRW